MLGADDESAGVDAHHLVERLERQLDDTAGQIGVGGVGEVHVHPVEAAERVDGELDDRDDGILVGAVERNTAHPLTRRIEVGGDARRQLGVEVADHEQRALVGVAPGQAVADAAESRNDDNLVLEQSRHRSDPSRNCDEFRAPVVSI